MNICTFCGEPTEHQTGSMGPNAEHWGRGGCVNALKRKAAGLTTERDRALQAEAWWKQTNQGTRTALEKAWAERDQALADVTSNDIEVERWVARTQDFERQLGEARAERDQALNLVADGKGVIQRYDEYARDQIERRQRAEAEAAALREAWEKVKRWNATNPFPDHYLEFTGNIEELDKVFRDTTAGAAMLERVRFAEAVSGAIEKALNNIADWQPEAEGEAGEGD